MRIALIGYGKMGQEIERLLNVDKKHEVVSISYKKETDTLDLDKIKGADVAIDFTSPEIVLKNIQSIAKLGISMVVGTTGWEKEMKKVEDIVTKNDIGLIYGGNFSIGANIFFQITKFASKLFSKYDSFYDVYGSEIHHQWKKDSPSGTAKKLSDIIVKNFPAKKKPDDLNFSSVRGGVNPGRHEITFDSAADEVALIHQAHNRQGFAKGAILAAEFIHGKKGLYRFEELFEKGNL